MTEKSLVAAAPFLLGAVIGVSVCFYLAAHYVVNEIERPKEYEPDDEIPYTWALTFVIFYAFLMLAGPRLGLLLSPLSVDQRKYAVVLLMVVLAIFSYALVSFGVKFTIMIFRPQTKWRSWWRTQPIEVGARRWTHFG